MALTPLPLGVFFLCILTASALRGGYTRTLGRSRNIPLTRPSPIPSDRLPSQPDPDLDQEDPEPLPEDDSCVLVKVHDAHDRSHPHGVPNYDRYHYGYGYSRDHGWGYGYHHRPVDTEMVATCAALNELREEVRNISMSLNNTNIIINAELVSVKERITIVENQLADLSGIGKNLIRVMLTLRGSERRVCAFNSIIEVAELCRRFRNRLNNPYFIHLPCDDPSVAEMGDECYEAPNFWYLEPLCFTGVNEPGFFQCFKDPEPGQTCNQIGYLSCNGYATGRLGNTPNALTLKTEVMNMVAP